MLVNRLISSVFGLAVRVGQIVKSARFGRARLRPSRNVNRKSNRHSRLGGSLPNDCQCELLVSPGLAVACLVAGLVCCNVEAQSGNDPSPKQTDPAKPAATESAEAQPKLEKSTRLAQTCSAQDRFFEDEVWAKVGERTCLRCHHAKGDAADSGFVLVPRGAVHDSRWLQQNCDAFSKMARSMEGDQSRLLTKVAGGLDHGGGQTAKPDSTSFKILQRFVRRLDPQATSVDPPTDYAVPPFFEGVVKVSPQQLLRRVTLSLAGRMPTAGERGAIEKDPAVIDAILDQIFREDAFYVRLKEGFNDIFLLTGIEELPYTLLSYDQFGLTRTWANDFDLSHVPEADREKARWKLVADYNESLRREPLAMIEYIVRNDRPFSDLATADYIMVSPYSARGYGIFEELKGKFKNVNDPFEYIPAQLKAVKIRGGQETQESATGLYPHAGFLSMFHYLRRYPSTETNRNRLRARMFYQHFLGIDIMQLAPRVTDAAAVAVKYKVPTMEASDCVVCHKTIDPVASLFQDFGFEGYVNPRKEGWYGDMFQAGFEGEVMPAGERWRAPQWLGERVVKDPRYPIAVAEQVYYFLMGRKVLQPPEDIDDPSFNGKRRGYLAQRQMIEEVGKRYAAANFNLKAAIKAMIATDFYQVDGLATLALHPLRKAELDDVGIVRLLSPEQLERKVGAIFGKPWGRLDTATDREFNILYGGIDALTITERNADPSGAMGAIQRMLANEIACRHVANDFHVEASQRLLFSQVELTDLPGDAEADQKIRRTIVSLYRQIHGLEWTSDHPEVERTYRLFSATIAAAKSRANPTQRDIWACSGGDSFQLEDPHYTQRAWRSVVTYLLRQHEFLYE